MDNKYKKTLIDYAIEYDNITNSCGKIIELATSITKDGNKEPVISLLKVLSDTINSDKVSSKIKRIANALKTSIIEYCGYISIMDYAASQLPPQYESRKTIDELFVELNNLVGLSTVKEKINDLIAYMTVQRLRAKQSLVCPTRTMHMAFTGNPGTGKTTVARIIGQMYKQLGILSKGIFFEVSRTDLIAGYQGQTALKVKKVIDMAKGGVLFIDEAYSITENDHADSYGRECLTELTKALEDYRDDLVVIVAGYTEPMKHFFSSNPGLKSRFNVFIEFPDYSSQELLTMLKMLCSKNDYVLDDAVTSRLSSYFEEQTVNKDENFANGRLVRNLFDDLVMHHAKRVFDIDKKTTDLQLLSVITAEDFYAEP